MSELTRLLKQAMGATDPARLVGCVIAANAALDAHNHEVELATARKVLEAVCKAVCSACYAEEMLDAQELAAPWDLHGPVCEGIRNAVLALYPELAQPVEPSSDGYNPDEDFDYPAALAEAACDDVSELVEPGKEHVDD